MYESRSESFQILFHTYLFELLGTSGGVMVSKLDSQTYTSEFESHWVPHSFGLVLNRSKDLRNLLYLFELLVGSQHISNGFD